MSIKLNNVEAILAIDECNGLSKNNKIPWNSKKDMLFFKNKTINNIVIMGLKTLLSLPNSQPLKDRVNIVITNNKNKYLCLYKNCGNIIFMNFEECYNYIKTNNNHKNIYIIGGSQIYNLFLPFCSTIWMTKIKYNHKCDLFFNYDISMYNKKIIYEDNNLEIMQLT